MKTLNVDQIDALLALIDFHDDWEFVGEKLGVCIPALEEVLYDIRDELVTLDQVSTTS
jgi:hypothetical protein